MSETADPAGAGGAGQWIHSNAKAMLWLFGFGVMGLQTLLLRLFNNGDCSRETRCSGDMRGTEAPKRIVGYTR
jgi:hypothetical protein